MTQAPPHNIQRTEIMTQTPSLPQAEQRSRIFPPLLFLLLLLSACVGPGAQAMERNLEGKPDLDLMLGQMLLVGFRGAKLDENDPIVLDVAQGRVGGVVLFDYDLGPQDSGPQHQKPGATPETHRLSPGPCAHPPVHRRGPGRRKGSTPQAGIRLSRFSVRAGVGTLRRRDHGSGRGRCRRRPGGDGNQPEFRARGGCERSIRTAPPSAVWGPKLFSKTRQQRLASAGPSCRGCAGSGCSPALKHFPGHGSARADFPPRRDRRHRNMVLRPNSRPTNCSWPRAAWTWS